MNKKLLTGLISLSVITLSAMAYDYTKQELEMMKMKSTISSKIRACKPYTYSGDTFIAKVTGIKNRKCIYTFITAQNQINCEFKQTKLPYLTDEDIQASCEFKDHMGRDFNVDNKLNFLFR